MDYYPLEFPPPLPGSQPEACRFQEGDLVQIIPDYDYDNLHLGIVHRPYSPQQVAAFRERNPDIQLEVIIVSPMDTEGCKTNSKKQWCSMSNSCSNPGRAIRLLETGRLAGG